MVDIMCFHKFLNIIIGTVMKDPEMLKFVHLKTKVVSMQLKNYLIY